jgi:hypothetical protein
VLDALFQHRSDEETPLSDERRDSSSPERAPAPQNDISEGQFHNQSTFQGSHRTLSIIIKEPGKKYFRMTNNLKKWEPVRKRKSSLTGSHF